MNRSVKMIVVRKLEAKVKKLMHSLCHKDRANKLLSGCTNIAQKTKSIYISSIKLYIFKFII